MAGKITKVTDGIIGPLSGARSPEAAQVPSSPATRALAAANKARPAAQKIIDDQKANKK